MNPGGFDSRHGCSNEICVHQLRAHGPQHDPAIRLHAMVWTPHYTVERARSNLRAQLKCSSKATVRGVLLALVLGAQRAISDADWTLFNARDWPLGQHLRLHITRLQPDRTHHRRDVAALAALLARAAAQTLP